MSDVQPTGGAAGRSVWTIVVAGGSGRRFGSMKQFESLDGRRVLDLAVGVAAACSDGVVIVVPADDVDDESRRCGPPLHFRVVAGGPTRTASVRAGLAVVPEDAEIVVVHDAARPFASRHLFAAVIDAVRAGVDGAIPGLPVVDTVKVIEVRAGSAAGSVIPHVVSTPDRGTLVAVQTPQAFSGAMLRRAHQRDVEGTDDASLVEAIGGTVVVVPGEIDNRKITLPEDLEWARRHVSRYSDDGASR